MDDQIEKNLPLELDAYNQLLIEKADALKNLAEALKEFHSQPECEISGESNHCPEQLSELMIIKRKLLLKSKK